MTATFNGLLFLLAIIVGNVNLPRNGAIVDTSNTNDSESVSDTLQINKEHLFSNRHLPTCDTRACRASVPDIADLFFAADNCVLPQTQVAIGHALATDVFLVVALNEKPFIWCGPTRRCKILGTRELLTAKVIGDVDVVKTVAVTGEDLDDFLETLLLSVDLGRHEANRSIGGGNLLGSSARKPSGQ